MSKKYRVDLNIDKEGIPPQHFINKTQQLEGGGFGEYSPAEFSVQLIMNAVSSGHPKGNIQTLKRTIKLQEELTKCAQNGGIIDLDQEDFKYLRGSFDKSSEWNNSMEAATVVCRVYSAFEQAKEV
jgi:hypothetical protein